MVRNLCAHCLCCFRQTALTKILSGWQSLIPGFIQSRFSRSYVLRELCNPHNFLCTQTEICIMTFQGYVFLFALSLGIYYIDYWDSPVGHLGSLPSWGLVPICPRLLSHVYPELLFPVLIIWYLSRGFKGPNNLFFLDSLCPILRPPSPPPTIVLFIRRGTLVRLPSEILGNFQNILISSLLSRLWENMLLSTSSDQEVSVIECSRTVADFSLGV